MRSHVQAALWRIANGQGNRFAVPAPPRAPKERKRGAIAAAKAKRARRAARNLSLVAAVAAIGACSGSGSHGGEAVRVVSGPTPPRWRLASEVVPTTQPPAPPSSAAVTRSEPSGRARVPSPRPRSVPSGDDFWQRLANCENPSGRNGQFIGYFQFSRDTAAKVGINGSESYEVQKAAAQRWATMVDPGSRSGWPICWWKAQ